MVGNYRWNNQAAISPMMQPETGETAFQAALMIAADGNMARGCRGLPLLAVGGETPARAKIGQSAA